mgnify:CR=1 FL=1
MRMEAARGPFACRRVGPMLQLYEERNCPRTPCLMIGDWQSSIAHADMADWVTVAAYFLAAILCWRAERHAWLQRSSREKIFWRSTAIFLVLLGINELLDLQTLLTMIGRAHAKANGWYPDHRRIQYLFIVALAIGALCLGAALLWLTRRMHYSVRLALGGLVFIGLFILLRAASFHHLYEILGRGAADFPLGWIQEMAGILLVAAAALLYRPER